MKTSELRFQEIENQVNVGHFLNIIKQQAGMENEPKDTWVGEFIYEIIYKDKEVGYIAYSNWNNSCCLSCVYINERYRNQGIATASIRKLQFMITQKKTYKIMYGFVHKTNKNAIQLYKKLGFKYLDNNGYYTVLDPSEDKCKLDKGIFYEFGKELL